MPEFFGHLGYGGVGDIGQFPLGERRREVLVNDPCLGMLGGGELTAAVLGVDLRRLTTLARFLANTLITSSSESSLACLPETSSVWIAASSMRMVAVRSLSCVFIAWVRSDRSWDLSSAIAQTLRAATPETRH